MFGFYCLSMLIVQIASVIFRKLGYYNLFLSHFYFIMQFVFLSLFYIQLLKEPLQRKIVKINLIICPIILALQYAIKPDLFFRFNYFEIFITSITLIIYATFHLYNMLNVARHFYYVNLGILIYLFGSTVVFLVGNLSVALNSKSSFSAIWDLNIYLYVIYQLFLTYEWTKNYKISNSK